MWICSMEPWVFYMCDMSWILTKRQKRGWWDFSTKFSRIIIFSMELYFEDQLCSKCIRKSFVSYPVIMIQAYKYCILMTLQSTIATTVTIIAGILVCIMVRVPIGSPPAP